MTPDWASAVSLSCPHVSPSALRRTVRVKEQPLEWILRARGAQVPGGGEERAAGSALPAQLRHSPPCQRRSLGVPSPPVFLCQGEAARHLISRGKECAGLRGPLPARQLVPHGGPGGAWRSSGDFREERSFSRHFCDTAQAQRSAVCPGAPHQMPTSTPHSQLP